VTSGTSNANPTVAPPPSTSTTAVSSQNPNLKNIDKFFAALDGLATKQKISATDLIAMKEKVLKDVATTTDLRAAFLKIVERNSRQSVSGTYSIGSMLAKIKQAFDIFRPEHARAATGIPFGGALLFSYFCEDSGNYILTMEPLPPSYAVFLSYYEFSQAFLSYNIPFTTWLLGEYEPPGMCVTLCPYCVYTPTEGTITPIVGSSPT
jgi:hypothetical protein